MRYRAAAGTTMLVLSRAKRLPGMTFADHLQARRLGATAANSSAHSDCGWSSGRGRCFVADGRPVRTGIRQAAGRTVPAQSGNWIFCSGRLIYAICRKSQTQLLICAPQKNQGQGKEASEKRKAESGKVKGKSMERFVLRPGKWFFGTQAFTFPFHLASFLFCLRPPPDSRPRRPAQR